MALMFNYNSNIYNINAILFEEFIRIRKTQRPRRMARDVRAWHGTCIQNMLWSSIPERLVEDTGAEVPRAYQRGYADDKAHLLPCDRYVHRRAEQGKRMTYSWRSARTHAHTYACPPQEISRERWGKEARRC